MANHADARAASGAHDTFPKLLALNATRFATRPAMRHKDLGIWQSHSWGHVAAEIRLFAAGLADLGFRRGDRLIVVGDNRPLLYWSMCAAQSLGGVPVPVYQDSVADELAYVVEHAGARFALAENQEQVDKLLEIQKKVPTLEVVIYQDPRGLRHYTGLLSTAEVQARGPSGWTTTPDLVSAEVARGRGSDDAIMLYTSGTTGRPKGAVLSYDNLIWAATAGAEFDGLKEGDELLSYLPMAWVGDHIFSYAQWLRGRAGGELPRIGGHGDDRPARDRPDLLLCAAPRAGKPDHPGDDPHGGCGLHQAPAVPVLHGRGAQGRAQPARRPAGVAARSPALRPGQPADLRAAQEHAGHEPRARRLYGGRGGGAGDLQLLSRARREHEAALRPDRGLGVRHHPSQRRGLP